MLKLESSIPMRPVAAILVAACALLVLASNVAWAAGKITIIDRTKVYYGKVDKYKKPAVIKRLKVYEKIDAYKTIKKEKLKPGDARYHFLEKQASDLFKKKVKEVAKEKGYDLVIEKSAVVSTGTPLKDLTELVIKKVKGTP